MEREQAGRQGLREGGGNREDIIAGGLMRRHNCTIIDDRFIRRPGTTDWNCTEDTAPPWSHIIIRRRGAPLLGVGMSGWSEMTITEDPAKRALPPLGPLQPLSPQFRAAILGMRCRSSAQRASLYPLVKSGGPLSSSWQFPSRKCPPDEIQVARQRILSFFYGRGRCSERTPDIPARAFSSCETSTSGIINHCLDLPREKISSTPLL